MTAGGESGRRGDLNVKSPRQGVNVDDFSGKIQTAGQFGRHRFGIDFPGVDAAGRHNRRIGFKKIRNLK